MSSLAVTAVEAVGVVGRAAGVFVPHCSVISCVITGGPTAAENVTDDALDLMFALVRQLIANYAIAAEALHVVAITLDVHSFLRSLCFR